MYKMGAGFSSVVQSPAPSKQSVKFMNKAHEFMWIQVKTQGSRVAHTRKSNIWETGVEDPHSRFFLTAKIQFTWKEGQIKITFWQPSQKYRLSKKDPVPLRSNEWSVGKTYTACILHKTYQEHKKRGDARHQLLSVGWNH